MQSFFFLLPHAVWLEACLECLAGGGGVTHHERGCQHQVVPLITGLLLSGLGVPVLSLITRCIYSGYAALHFPTQTECAVKWVLYFPVIIALQFLFSQAELGVVSFEAGIYWLSVGSERIPVRECDLSKKERHENHKGIRSHCFIVPIS